MSVLVFQGHCFWKLLVLCKMTSIKEKHSRLQAQPQKAILRVTCEGMKTEPNEEVLAGISLFFLSQNFLQA